jgi:hypothetical protein
MHCLQHGIPKSGRASVVMNKISSYPRLHQYFNVGGKLQFSNMKELQIKVESLQSLLIDVATGGSAPGDLYRELRAELLAHFELKSQIPDFIQTNRTIDQFWEYIKFKFPTYAARRKFIREHFDKTLNYLESKQGNIVANHALQAITKVDENYIKAEWEKALHRISADPEAAITSARTLIETTCKYILDQLNVDYDDVVDLPKLYKIVADNLNLAPDRHTEPLFKQILGGCQSVVNGLGALRNKLSDSHGKKATQARPSKRHAEFAVNLAGSMTLFLLETYSERDALK